jgi:hypothetical protein
MGNIDTDPRAPQFLGGMNRCAATAERIEHKITWIARCVNEALQ